MYCCLPVLAQAQQFRYGCNIRGKIEKTGFYRVVITPEMSAHMQPDFRDVRVIADSSNQEFPYIIRSRRKDWGKELFKPFAITKNYLDDSGRSVIVFKKDVVTPISALSLILKNASVYRKGSLSGSNDGKKWFIISEQIAINYNFETIADSSIQSISFPISSYPYFQLKIDNAAYDPLNVIRIGIYENEWLPTFEPYIKNPKLQISQTDSSNHISYIRVNQNQSYPVYKFTFKITRPLYFSRNIQISTIDNPEKKHQRHSEIISSSFSGSDSFYEIITPVMQAKNFMIEVENGNNLPLKINSVDTYQPYHELIAWLETGKEYIITMDNANAVAPTYDLELFKDSIPDRIPLLTVGKPNLIQTTQRLSQNSAFPQKWLWLIMAGAVMLLAILTWRLTGEMRKKEA